MLARSERWDFGSKCTPFSEFSMHTDERKSDFLIMMWNFGFISFQCTAFELLFHRSNTESLLPRDIVVLNLYPKFVPLKNVWGKLIYVYALGGYDVPKIRILLVSIWLPRVVLSGQCVKICMLVMIKEARKPKLVQYFETCVIKSMKNVLTWLFQLQILPCPVSTANIHKFLNMSILQIICN